MGVEWSFTYIIILLQVLAGLVVLRSKLEPRLATQIFGALFLFNAGVSAIMGLPRDAAIWIASDPGFLTRAFRALDAPTGYLLLAFLAARSPRPGARRWAFAFIIVGAVVALAEFPFHRTMVEYEYIFRAIPLYAGLGMASYVLAAGRPWERWVALALIARALYWGVAGVLDVARSGLGDVAHLFVNRAGLVLLAAAALAASVRLLRSEDPLPSSVVVPVLLIGPAAALFETGVSLALPASFRYGSLVLVNLVTLGLVRPVLALMGMAREMLFPVLVRVTLASGIAVASTMVAPAFLLTTDMPHADAVTTYGFGLMVGLLAIAALEGAPPISLRRPDAAPPPIGGDPETGPGAAMRLKTTGRPQWQVLLEILKGSSLPSGVSTTGELRLTQKALAEALGVRPSRIASIVSDLNEPMGRRLDQYTPQWRATHPPGLTIEVVRQFRGTIPGNPGVWVYYRLTPIGERLAEAAQRDFLETSAPS